MTESVRALRASVQIGSLTVDWFMLPDGSYRMSQTKVAEAAGLSRRNVSDFLRSNALKSLLVQGYTSTIFEGEEIEIESESGRRGQSRFLSVPPEIASAYWLWQAHRGNKAALALCVGFITESLKRRVDEAFEVTRTPTGAKQDPEPTSSRTRTGYPRSVRLLTMKPESNATTTSAYERENGINPWGVSGAGDESG